MNKHKVELKRILDYESTIYSINKRSIEKRFRKNKNILIWDALKKCRIFDYICTRRDECSNSVFKHFWAFRVKLADRKRNNACQKVNLELETFRIKKGIRICHNNVLLTAEIGENCIFHGNNAVGQNKTGEHTKLPRIGNCVDVGYGAMIFGDVDIADNCVIGAGAVVTKSFTQKGSILVGVPAKCIGVIESKNV